MSESLFELTETCRIVQGDCFKPDTKDPKGKLFDKPKYWLNIAWPKGPGWDAFYAKFYARAQADFPGGEWQQTDFAWKILDGDAAPHAQKEGWPGHFILRCGTTLTPEIYDNQAQPQQILDARSVKCGDYIRVHLSISGNGQARPNTPGMYVNHLMIQWLGSGPEIRTRPSAAQVFGTPAGQLPAGASATPQGGAPIAGPPGTTGAPVGAAPASTAPVGAPPAGGLAGAPGFVGGPAVTHGTPPAGGTADPNAPQPPPPGYHFERDPAGVLVLVADIPF